MASDDEGDELVPDISNTDDKESTATDDDVASSEPAEADLTVGLSLAECVEKANAHKAEGNEHFKASRSREAVACYGLGVRYLTKHKLEAEARPLLVALHTNSAACHIREEAWAEAIAAANSSVEIDLTHKALYRRGVAYARLGQLDEAKAKDDLATVCRADAKNREARTELAAVSAALKARKEGERKAYGSMFSGKSMQKARAKTDVVRIDDEDDLKDMIKGYKKTSDGKTTSYFTREVDAETKAMLDELKQPKRLDPQQAAAPAVAPGASSGGSAWNAAGTWEEKDLSKWAQDTLTARLKGLHASAAPSAAEMQALLTQQLASMADAADAGAAEGKAASGLEEATASLLLKVTDVKKCEGSASVQSSRGRVKHIYDLTFEIEWEATLQPLTDGAGAEAAAAPKKPGAKCKGTLSYAEVTSAAASDASKYEVSSQFKKAPTAALKARAEAGVEQLRAEVAKALEAFAAEFKTKVI